MGEISTIGIDLAKNVFQLHGVTSEGQVLLRRQLRRAQVLVFFARLQPCLIGVEACAGAHFWARELAKLGHEVRLMPPSYVKAYVKRGKTDAADAEAICEAVTRPSMRFVPVKTEDQQAVLLMHRTRDFLVRQLTQTGNAIRAHLGEFGLVVAKGVHNMERLFAAAGVADLPDVARNPIRLLVEQFRDTHEKIEDVTAEIKAAQKDDETARRLETIPGIGPLTSSAIAAFVGQTVPRTLCRSSKLPDVANFRCSCDLSAWIGLTPKPYSSGGKERLGRISKMGNRYIRRLLYLGASCAGARPVRRRRSARERGVPRGMTGCATCWKENRSSW